MTLMLQGLPFSAQFVCRNTDFEGEERLIERDANEPWALRLRGDESIARGSAMGSGDELEDMIKGLWYATDRVRGQFTRSGKSNV